MYELPDPSINSKSITTFKCFFFFWKFNVYQKSILDLLLILSVKKYIWKEINHSKKNPLFSKQFLNNRYLIEEKRRGNFSSPNQNFFAFPRRNFPRKRNCVKVMNCRKQSIWLGFAKIYSRETQIWVISWNLFPKFYNKSLKLGTL